MPRRVGGLDPAEINEALGALSRAASLDDLRAAIDAIPALRTPVLHAILRQQYLELRNARNPGFENFEPRYVDFFWLLHERWHAQLVRDARARFAGGERRSVDGEAVVPWAPPYWRALHDAVGMHLPADRGPRFDPARDANALRQELRALTGGAAQLPAYELTDGSRWCALTVGCASCGTPRLDVRAYIADLVLDPTLAAPLRAQSINNSRCRRCGEVLSYPIRVWVLESPGPGDPLATLSCVWRLAPDVFSYQPPPGTPRVEENDRILEVRFHLHAGVMSWPEPPALADRTGAVNTTITVSYSSRELVHYHERAAPETSAAETPFAMETLVGEMTRKVASGVLPLHLAMDNVWHHVAAVGREWPVLNPGRPHEWQGDALAHLFHCLVAEAVLRAGDASEDARAMFAAMTTSSLLAMGEGALAEAALARADDALKRSPAGRTRDLAALAIDDVRADWLEFQGRFDEAQPYRDRLRTVPELLGDTLPARVAKLGLASQEALSLYKRDQHGPALRALRDCIGNWEALLAGIGASDAGNAESLIRGAKHALSGDLSNAASVLMSLMDDLAVFQIMQAPGLSAEQRVALLREATEQPQQALDRLDQAFPELEALIGPDITQARLAGAADQFLHRALALSEEVEGWEFAGVQAHRLAVLHQTARHFDAAEEFATRAVRYAARAGDHERVWTAQALLAHHALERGDGPGALDHLEAAARDRIRHEVGTGDRGARLRGAEAIGDAACRAVAAGGDPSRAVAIVESLRAAHTAAALVSGTPFQTGSQELPGPLRALEAERERLDLRLLWSPDDVAARQRLGDVEVQLAEERRQLSLRDARYGRWVDATDVGVASPSAIARRMAHVTPHSFWLGALALPGHAWSYAVRGPEARVEAAPMPDVDARAGHPAGKWTEQVLQNVADTLLAPHAAWIDALTPADMVVLSTSGSLQEIPFAALPWKGRRLCERVTLVAVQGFGMMEAAMDRAPIPLGSFALLGAPQRPDLAPLAGAEQELDGIGALLRDQGREVVILSGMKATVAALVSAARQHDAIHISCHAFTATADGKARLMLSPDLIAKDSGDLPEDRVVTDTKVRAGALVNLAGCATGAMHEPGALQLGGLVPAFLLAGARSVIASLWPIEDEPAALFQQEFYRQLLSGAGPAAALAATQRRAVQGDLGDRVSEVAVWAAYAAYGAG